MLQVLTSLILDKESVDRLLEDDRIGILQVSKVLILDRMSNNAGM